MAFNHLHLHTVFSPLDGVGRPHEYIDKCVEYNMSGIAITDHGTLAGIPDMYTAAKEKGIKMIAGCELYLNDYHIYKLKLDERKASIKILKDKDPELLERIRRNRHVTILAKNAIGWRNLLNIMREAWDKNYYYKPRANTNLLKQYHEGLILLSGCLNGPVSFELRLAIEAQIGNENRPWLKDPEVYINNAKKYIRKYREIFKDDFFMEFQILDTSIDLAPQIYKLMYEIWQENFNDIPAVITNDVHYINQNDFEIQMIMMAISQGTTVDDPNLFHTNTDEQYFKTSDQIIDSWKKFGYNEFIPKDKLLEMMENTQIILDKCENFEADSSSKLPSFPNADKKLRSIVYKRLSELGLDKIDKKFEVDGKMVTFKEQLEIELDRIISKNFESYFLIVADVIKYYIDMGYEKGPGRGSAAGSLVCYLLGITDINPIYAGLSFDRFLSASRGGHMLKTTMD